MCGSRKFDEKYKGKKIKRKKLNERKSEEN